MYIRQENLFSFNDWLKMKPKSKLEILLNTLELEPYVKEFEKFYENRKGRKPYSQETLLNCLIAMRAENIVGLTSLVNRLEHDPHFKYLVGFDIFDRVPSISTFSRFFSKITEAGILGKLFNDLVITADEMGIIDTSTISIDATKLEAYEKSIPQKRIPKDGVSANWGKKKDTDGNTIKWFGYKLHAGYESRLGLAISLSLSPASLHDSQAAPHIIKDIDSKVKHKPEYWVMDAAYDSQVLYELIRYTYHAQAVTPLNDRGAKEPKAGFSFNGTPICSAGFEMIYWGSDKQSNKFRCPHILGKCNCPFGSAWCSSSNYGMVVKTRIHDDIRLFTVPHRESENWNKIYNKRTGAERGFALLKEHLGLESGLRVRGIAKVLTHTQLSAVISLAAVIAVNQKDSEQELAA